MLHHPNIIEYYDSFLHDKSMMIVMEYAAGGTLFDLVESRAADQVRLVLAVVEANVPIVEVDVVQMLSLQ